jgi:hypothetical protein
MQIHELNALSRAPQTGDVLAIDTGTDTAKIDYNALATAIINKLGGDPVTIPHGGTGKGNLADLQSMIFGGYTLSGITAYPTSPGLYRNTDSLSTGMPTGASPYGTLIIIAGGEASYNLHLYADALQNLYYAFTDNVTPPSEWRNVTSTIDGLLDVPHGGTGVNGVEESQISINPDLAALGLNVSLRDNITTAAKIRRWGKLYTMQYDAVLSQSTYTGATNWHPLIVDNKGWLSSQAANMPYFAWANSDYQLLHGINLWCENGRTYGVSFISVNLTWIDPN